MVTKAGLTVFLCILPFSHLIPVTPGVHEQNPPERHVPPLLQTMFLQEFISV